MKLQKNSPPKKGTSIEKLQEIFFEITKDSPPKEGNHHNNWKLEKVKTKNFHGKNKYFETKYSAQTISGVAKTVFMYYFGEKAVGKEYFGEISVQKEYL